MKNIFKHVGIIALVAVIGFALIGCSNPSGGGDSFGGSSGGSSGGNSGGGSSGGSSGGGSSGGNPTPGIVIPVSSTVEWNDALNTIKNGGNGTAINPKTYTITVSGNIEVLGSSYYGSFGTVSNVAVTINGNGKLYIIGQGSLLSIYVSSQTVYIDSANLTLQGLRVGQNDSSQNNNAPIVYIEGGVLELRNGTISDNNNISSSGGGGVFVGGGSFTMTGGTISNNTNSYGGGVCVIAGSFTMSGGTISNNNSNLNENMTYGGGVYITNSSFTMSGGTISNNTTGFTPIQYGKVNSSFGGGVCISSGTFTMSGGTISDNTVRGGYNLIYGGSGSILTDVSGIPFFGGGGVCIYSSGTFIKSNGGIISGNNGSPYGQEVMEYNGSNSYRYRNTMLDTADNISTNTQSGWNM